MARLEDWLILEGERLRLQGWVFGHERFLDGEAIVTGPVISVSGTTVVAMTGTYELGRMNGKFHEHILLTNNDWDGTYTSLFIPPIYPRLEVWSVVQPEQPQPRLQGNIYNYYRFPNGQTITTAPIVEANGLLVSTVKMTYQLGIIDATYLAWLREHRPGWNPAEPITPAPRAKRQKSQIRKR